MPTKKQLSQLRASSFEYGLNSDVRGKSSKNNNNTDNTHITKGEIIGTICFDPKKHDLIITPTSTSQENGAH